jgi:hypothetical protein
MALEVTVQQLAEEIKRETRQHMEQLESFKVLHLEDLEQCKLKQVQIKQLEICRIQQQHHDE